MRFFRVRAATLIWGFLVSYFFTGNIGIASKIFLVMALGNTIIMWKLLKD